MSSITPLERYQTWVKAGKLEANIEQETVLGYLTHIRQQLIGRQKLRRGTFSKITQHLKSWTPVRGLYLWGGVGVGKTMLMDLFYDTLPVTKLRLHFHAFMQQLHTELRALQGEINPLAKIGQRLSDKYWVICFDEFLVTNVADAMILAELFKALFKGGVCLVTTANLPPERLYENGLQRQRFVPVIHLIQQYTSVVNVSIIHDYRRRVQEQISAYYSPLGSEAEKSIRRALTHFAGDAQLSDQPLIIAGREIPVIQRAEKVIWFEFKVICGKPRSQEDYLALTKLYSVVIVSNVPCLESVSYDWVVAFINLVDILYDARVQLILSAAVPISELYTQGLFVRDFQRTESRIFAMQTKEFINP